jgi:hypothetical protein
MTMLAPPATVAPRPRRDAPGGALLQVIEYVRFAPDGRPIDVRGPSFKFDYRQEGRALQAQIWLRPATVEPRLKVGALRIFDRLRQGGAPR